MSESLYERAYTLPVRLASPTLLDDVADGIFRALKEGEVPVRFAVTESDCDRWHCELGIHSGGSIPDSIFHYERRKYQDSQSFNLVMLVPTGIGAVVGGHAGDASLAGYSPFERLRFTDYSPQCSECFRHYSSA